MKEVYLHVGLPKTGTTFLQERCFPRLKGVHLVRKEYKAWPPPIIELLWRVAEGFPLFVDMDERRAEVDRFLRGIGEDKVLISYERLTGDTMWSFRDHASATESLRELFPAARIIFTIRRQDDILEGFYRQHLRNFYYPTIDGYLNYRDGRFGDMFRPTPAFPSISVWRLDYYTYARNYAALFGRPNVKILPYEMMRAEPRRFHGQIAEFLGVEPYEPPAGGAVNRSYSLLSCHLAQRLNRFARVPWREQRPWQVIPPKPLQYALENIVDRVHYKKGNFISAEKRRRIMEIHHDSNRRLAAEHDLDLQRYGYY